MLVSDPDRPPQTIDEVVDILLEEMSDEDREEIREMDRGDLFELHFSLGMSIRNRFVYPGGDALMKSASGRKYGEIPESPDGSSYLGVDADDVSDQIVGALWERLHQDGETG